MEAERILLKWLKTPIGALLQREIKHHIDSIIPKPKGSYLLNLGLPDITDTLKDFQVPFKWSITETLNEPIYYDGLSHFDALPFHDELFDYVILAYPGFYQNEASMLFHEMERVLAPDGYLFLFDVNPYSLLGTIFNRFVKQKGGEYQFNSLNPTCRIIKQNAFCIQEIDNFFYRIPKQNETFLKRTKFLETLCPLFLFYPAGFYGVCARKVSYNVITVKDKWAAPIDGREELEMIS